MNSRSGMILLIAATVLLITVMAATAARKQAAKPAMMMAVPKQAQRLQKSINSYKTQLTKTGKYACCVKPSCDFCATHMGGCPCGMNAAADKPVCRECKGGWEAGEGTISGKTAADIKAMPAMMGDHKM
jgi:hypothetical protein